MGYYSLQCWVEASYLLLLELNENKFFKDGFFESQCIILTGVTTRALRQISLQVDKSISPCTCLIAETPGALHRQCLHFSNDISIEIAWKFTATWWQFYWSPLPTFFQTFPPTQKLSQLFWFNLHIDSASLSTHGPTKLMQKAALIILAR